MTADWVISAALEAELSTRLEKFKADYGPIDYRVYPSVMWSLGGEAYKPSDPKGTRKSLAPGYSTGFYRTDPSPKGDRLVMVPSARFEFVVFLPNDADLVSHRRLIDYDGEAIAVR